MYVLPLRVLTRFAYLLVPVGDLHWSIGHTSLSREEKEYNLSKARDRQWRAYSLPPGVSVEEMEDIWNQLDFGKRRQVEETPKTSFGDKENAPSCAPFLPSEERGSTFDPSYFSPPSRNVRLLRELSMKGKIDMESMFDKAKGQPKLIWGEPEVYIDQVGLNGVPFGTEVVETGEVAGEPLVVCEEAVLVDEYFGTNEVTAPLVDCSQKAEERQ